MLTAANAAEVLDQLVRIYRRDPDDAHADLALLANGCTGIVAVTSDQGLAAGRLRARHYHRERCAVSLADCLAAALAHRMPLATSDPALATVMRVEGGTVHPLADSKGTKPELSRRPRARTAVGRTRGLASFGGPVSPSGTSTRATGAVGHSGGGLPGPRDHRHPPTPP
jgi:hypothetical protein